MALVDAISRLQKDSVCFGSDNRRILGNLPLQSVQPDAAGSHLNIVLHLHSSCNDPAADPSDTPNDFPRRIRNGNRILEYDTMPRSWLRGLAMGLDLALGIIILVAAFRGWFHGFIAQSVKLGSLVACVYLADPVRAQAKPHVLPYLTSIQPELVDRILWWVAAVLVYVLLVGLGTLIIKMTKRPEIPGITQSARNDQFAGFLLGGAKGFLVAAFATAGIHNYAMDQVKSITWAQDQVNASWAIKWNEEYRPASRIWASRPVRHFVTHIQRMGLQDPGLPGRSSTDGVGQDLAPAVRTASRHPGLEIAGQVEPDSSAGSSSAAAPGGLSPEPGLLDPDTEQTVRDIKAELNSRTRTPN
jgi:uncharacterized membrane protein required for colicin V production